MRLLWGPVCHTTCIFNIFVHVTVNIYDYVTVNINIHVVNIFVDVTVDVALVLQLLYTRPRPCW